ncbi:S9 family peptidase [Chryseobacterium daecheongense]|uniref:Dipeptidyl-peptidase-4 n=1 Tax=Chryseobacterium daecheongense TaxID=192389 RepID=A0A3N0VXA3_9FLAO|nr:S9 family peptidase [Chryseobacterium daecheongense]ROH97404.1 S9 family peptidase [Chryseobacterium daecheongense]TDX93453.1 dipeptidyl-peptidase-4 [Chryseobacterium daecheongense]
MKLYRLSLLMLVLGGSVVAQTQKFTMAEAVNGLRSNLAVKNISQFSWTGDGKSYIQAVKGGYLTTDLKTGKRDTLVSLTQLNKHFTDKKLKAVPQIKFINGSQGYFNANDQMVWVEKSGNDWKIKNAVSVESEAANVKVFGDNETFAYTVKNNLYVNRNGKAIAVTNDSDENIISGQSVHRNEFGIDGGIFPAPNSESVAFYRMDQTMVADYPIIDWSVTPAVNHNIKYPMVGQTSHEVTLGVFNIKNQSTTFLKIEGEKDQYLTAITWSPDSKYIFVGVLNRGQNHLKMNQYDAATGNFIKTIFEETDSKYVEPQHPLVFFPNSNTDFIWQSQRTGYNHLFHYSLDKGLISQITKGDWLVTDILGFNEKKKEIYFASTKETPLERHLYKINWANFKMQRLDNADGMHTGILSTDGNYLYDVYSNADTPRIANIINTNTFKTSNILTAENPLKKYQRPEIKSVSLKADDGTLLYGKIILPTDFDPNKKYPVIVYLYNGPHLQLVTNTFPASGNLWYEYMAQNGYIIFTMDGRGSSNRGLKFEQAVFRNLGTTEMNDQMKGVDYLKSLPYVDAERMGIHGWSFGGFMTTSFMLRHPEVFKVGVAGGPVIDWKMYEIMYGERYMDTPQENPQGYATANLLDKVQNLKGKLLMIHGAQDDVVVWQHSVKFLKSAVDNGIQLDYFVYPGHPHNVIGKDRVHLMQKVTDYFDQYLKK